MPIREAPSWSTGLIEVAPKTYAYLQHDGSWGISNTGFMEGEDGLLVIDATMVTSMAEAFIKEIGRVTDKPIRPLINTHSHPDHTGGNRLFTGAEIISHRICREEMERTAERTSSDNPPPVMAAIPRTPAITRMFEMVANDRERQIVLPSVTFEDNMTLRYGDAEAHLLYYGPAHTFGDTLVYFPQSRVLFAGDTAFFYAMPLVGGSVTGWLHVIDRIKDLDIELIVPGHGPVGGRQELDDEREYFEFVREQARRGLEEGMTNEQAVKAMDLGPYAEWPESERMAANLLVAYRELRGEI
jgi:cyclase